MLSGSEEGKGGGGRGLISNYVLHASFGITFEDESCINLELTVKAYAKSERPSRLYVEQL